jgi:micrococcal nuclease
MMSSEAQSNEATMRMKAHLLLLFLLLAAIVHAEGPLSAAEAKNHIREKATVCGEVASTHYAERTKGSPTFINLDKPYPNQVFTIVIWGTDRPKFGSPDRAYAGKQICATGVIKDFRGVPEIVAYEPSQITVQ